MDSYGRRREREEEETSLDGRHRSERNLMNTAWKRHWPEYLMEGAELALFLVVACLLVALLEHPSSPVRRALPDPFPRRLLMGLAMGATAVAIVFSPLGKRSGAHFNPAVTL